MSNENDKKLNYYLNNKPPIILNHTDGPVLRLPDGSMHWLTKYERVCLAIGIFNLDSLVKRYKKKTISHI